MSFNTVEISEFDGNLVEYYKFTVGATTYRYNTSTRDVTLATGEPSVDGTYLASTISVGEPEHAREVSSTAVNIIVPGVNAVASLFTNTLPDAVIPVVVYRKHQSDAEVIAWWQGTIRSCEFRESEAQLLCLPTLGALTKNGIRMRFQVICNLQTYSTRCGLNPDDYKSTVTVSTISGLDITMSGMPAVADGYFNGGYIQKADGSKRFIANHAGNVLSLIIPFRTLSVSDSVSIFAGDDHIHTTCREKFTVGKPVGRGNIDNFFGFFRTPTRNIFTQGGLTRAGQSS